MPKLKIKKLLPILILIGTVLTSNTAIAYACPTQIDTEVLGMMADDNKNIQNMYLKELKTCLPHNADLQEQVDDTIIKALDEIDRFPEYRQAYYVNFFAEILKANAEAGYASSQHNYAGLYNAPPGSLLSKLIPQNYQTYMCWTKKAAAQKEPRALFNLAVRLAAKNAIIPGITYDPKTAYIILRYLQQTYPDDSANQSAQLAILMDAVNSMLMPQIKEQLGETQTKDLDTEIKQFDFKKFDTSCS